VGLDEIWGRRYFGLYKNDIENRDMKRRLFQFAGLVAAGTMLSGCWGGSYSWRQKLTVVVSTPDGDKTGSAVTEVSWWPNRFSGLWGSKWESSHDGEAVVVDLGVGRH
jgi:hypothetical protein